MVGAYEVNYAVGNGLAQCVALLLALYRRVALYPCTQTDIVFVAECEVCGCYLCCYFLVFGFVGRQQFKFFGCAYVHHMQACTEFFGKFHSACCALVTSLFAAYHRVEFYGRVFAFLLFYSFGVGGYYGTVFAMYGNGHVQPFGLLEYLFKLVLLVNKHVAGT